MLTRFSKRFLGLVLILTVFSVFACPVSATIIFSQDFNQPIPSPQDPDNDIGKGKMDDVIIDVPEHVIIDDLDVAVSLNHESFYDLEIVLSRPGGTAITLNCHSNDAFITRDEDGWQEPVGGWNRFLFDDEAPIAIEDAEAPLTQPFRPADGYKLSDFDGQDVFGQWLVQIEDFWPSHTGYLEHIELIINAPEPSTVYILGAMVLAIRLTKPRKAG